MTGESKYYVSQACIIVALSCPLICYQNVFVPVTFLAQCMNLFTAYV